MKTLTKREKNLLLVLLLVIILAGGVYFLVLPTGEAGDALAQEADDNAASYSEMQMEAAQIPILEQRLADAQAMLETARARQADAMTNDELDTLLTGLVLDAGLVPKAMELSDAGFSGVYSFGTDISAEDTLPTGTIYLNQARLTARGSLDGAQQLADAVAGNPAMLLTNWDAQEDDSIAGGGEYEITLQVTVFMRED